MKKSTSAMMKMEMGTPKSPIKRRTCEDIMTTLNPPVSRPSREGPPATSPPAASSSKGTAGACNGFTESRHPCQETAPVSPCSPSAAPGPHGVAGGAVPPVLTLPGRKALFLNLRRKKARKKVPAMRTRDSSAVLGCGSLGWTVGCTLYCRFSGWSLKIWERRGDGQGVGWRSCRAGCPVAPSQRVRGCGLPAGATGEAGRLAHCAQGVTVRLGFLHAPSEMGP